MTYVNYPTPTNIPGSAIPQDDLTNRRININSHTTIQPIVQSTISLSDAFKPKKAGKDTSHIVFVLDDSASMKRHAAGTISGFNEYLESQKRDSEETGIKTFVSLFKFDGGDLKSVYEKIDISEAEPLNSETYNPGGWSTNLYDAIGGVMMKVNELLSETKKKDRSSVIVTILTDGDENSSKIFRDDDVKKMVKKSEEKNWSFMFLGANIDAFSESSKLGFNQNNTMQYTTNNISETISTASAMTSRLKSGYTRGLDNMVMYATMGFTEDERKTSVGDKND